MYLEEMYQILPMNYFSLSMILILTLLSILSSGFFEFLIYKSLYKKKSKKIFKMMSLFSSFDPKSNLIFLFKELNWMIMIFLLVFLMKSMFTLPSRYKMISEKFIIFMRDQLKIAFKTQNDGSKTMFMAIFFFLFLSNYIGLVPNSFTSTSHISINLFMSLPLWMGFFIYGWKKYSNEMFSHLVPNGTPMPLISFMVLIELISTSIRPFTLSIRLMANMVSGHLLLTLMGNSMSMKNPAFVIFISFLQLVLLSLEMGVSAIQAYVFSILLSLYSDESDLSN